MKTILISNSSVKGYQKCPRYYYQNQLAEGHGIVSPYVEEDLFYGILIHEALPLLWQEQEVAGVITGLRSRLEHTFLQDPLWWTPEKWQQAVRKKKAREWGRLLEGHLWGIQRFVLPMLQRQYRLVSAEADGVKWLNAERTMGVLAKQDTLLYPLEDAWDAIAGVGYLEWKTCATANPRWMKQWKRNPQTWTGAMTTKAALGIELEWFRVCGLVKGVETRDEEGMEWRSGPLAWGWRIDPAMQQQVKGFTPPQEAIAAGDGSVWLTEGTTRKGWVKTSTDVFPGGVREWVKVIPEHAISKAFALTEPEIIDWDLAEEWLRNQQRGVMATVNNFHVDIEYGVPYADAVEAHFPRELSECESDEFGRQCGYHRACHDAGVKAEPLTWYVKRSPHHELERRMLGLTKGEGQ